MSASPAPAASSPSPAVRVAQPTRSPSQTAASASAFPLSSSPPAASASAALLSPSPAPAPPLLSSPRAAVDGASGAEAVLSGAVKDIVAGTVGGMTTVVVGHPLDTVKVRLQTSTARYSSTADCVLKTWRGEGVRGFYSGVQSPLAGEAFFNAVQFLAYGQSKQLLLQWRHQSSHAEPHAHLHLQLYDERELRISDFFIAGGLTGAASCLVECPVDLLKSQLQTAVHRSSAAFSSFPSAVAFIVRERGVVGLYQGLGPTFARTIPSTAAYFGCYEACRRGLMPAASSSSSAVSESAVILLAGGVGGFVYWLSTYPADCVKSAMQSDAIHPAQRRYSGVADCCRQLYAEGGWRRFYRGLAPCLLRAFPANAACFWSYEYAKRLLG
jgi:solute carrier family 25 carnitine/acylcarnitine transporter 20/29